MIPSKASISAFLFVTLAITLVTSAGTVRGDELGRLFTTAKERALLDELRHGKPVMDVEPIEIPVQKEVEVVEPTPVIEGVTINGLVYRKHGGSTAWVNGSSTIDGDLISQYISVDTTAIRGDRVPVIMPDNVTRVELKVGQTYDLISGVVVDVNEPRQIPKAPAQVSGEPAGAKN
ncbi:MAG: hypothetical protein L0Z68_03435 [Gammaproteobacteria bacterium]|nr:hypothetical protein [Gammaproteobacteria bacterium]